MHTFYKLIAKYTLLLFTLFLLSASTVQAQLPDVVKSTEAAFSRFANSYTPEIAARITETLIKRVQTSGELFEKTRNSYPANLSEFSSFYLWNGQTLTDDLNIAPEDLYPQKSFLQNQEQLRLYFLARNNREQTKYYRKLYARYQAIGRRLNDFKQAQTPITHPADQDLLWVIQQLPNNLSYLLLGEFHLFPDIMARVALLIHYLHYFAQPERQIIVLTEFLPEMTTYEPNIPLHSSVTYYKDIFEYIYKMDIPIIGLEPDVTSKMAFNKVAESAEAIGKEALDISHSVSVTLEGTRFRNVRFLKTIEKIRQQHPEALIIVWAGNTHIEYPEPYSLGKTLAGPETRVISLEPEYVPIPKDKERRWRRYITKFDIATDKQFINNRLIQFNDPELTKLSGADIRWRVSVSQEINVVN